jgi:hypothetical protein
MLAAARRANPPEEGSVVYRAILEDIELKFAPNKPVDIEFWQKKAQSINCRDGRGFQVNCNDFTEAIQELEYLNAAPDRMMMQKWISDHFLKDAPINMLTRLNEFGNHNEADAVLGAPQPAVPRWKTLLAAIARDISHYPQWDYIKSTDTKTEGRTVTFQAGATPTSFCYKCGKWNHAKKDCHSTACICGKYLNKLPEGHTTTDAAHDAKRVEVLKARTNQDSKSGRGTTGGRTGGRTSGRGGRGRGNPQKDSKDDKKADSKDKDKSKDKAVLPLPAQVSSLIKTNAAQADQIAKLQKSYDRYTAKSSRKGSYDDDSDSSSRSSGSGRSSVKASSSASKKKKRRTH